ncbi:MAG: hypothetical protein EXQ51_02045 [Acidobacteria bacterium]|nr:hypothetical protein [Acidobacteriota bacterium]
MQALVAGDHVDPVSHLESPDQGQDLVRRQIEGMQREPEFVMLNEWEETVGAVVDPFDEQAVVVSRDGGLYEPRTFANRGDRVAGVLKELPVSVS